LLTTIAIGLRSLIASPAIALSCWVTPSTASRTRKTTSERCMASSDRRREKYSTDDASFVAALIPAVSISLKAWSFLSRPLKSKGSSIASRVVPATSFTMRRLLFSRRFASDDFPTFGLPMKLMQMGPRSRLSSAASPPSGSAASGGRPILSRMASRSSDSPRPCSAETQMGSPRPRRATPSRSAFSSPKIRLVDDEDDGLAPAPEARGDPVVERRHPVEPVDDEEDERRRIDGEADLLLGCLDDRGRGGFALLQPQPAGVHERVAVPDLGRDDVAGHARLVVDDGDPLAREPVEEPALADIGPAYDDDGAGTWRHGVHEPFDPVAGLHKLVVSVAKLARTNPRPFSPKAAPGTTATRCESSSP